MNSPVPTSFKNIAERADDVNSHLPLLFKGYSVLPNVLGGGSLFGATFEKEKVVNSMIKNGNRCYQIYYSGSLLQQNDLNLYLRIIAYLEKKQYKIGENFWLEIHDFLSEFYKTSVPQKAYDLLEQSLWRLYSAEVVIIRPNLPPFFCRLISGRSTVFTANGGRKIVEISIDSSLREAFYIDGQSFVNMFERADLGSNQLALWLHLYYARHAKPHAITARFIYENSGSTTSDFNRWVRLTLVNAVEKINQLNGWDLFLDKNKGYEEAKLFCRNKPSFNKRKVGIRKIKTVDK